MEGSKAARPLVCLAGTPTGRFMQMSGSRGSLEFVSLSMYFAEKVTPYWRILTSR